MVYPKHFGIGIADLPNGAESLVVNAGRKGKSVRVWVDGEEVT